MTNSIKHSSLKPSTLIEGLDVIKKKINNRNRSFIEIQCAACSVVFLRRLDTLKKCQHNKCIICIKKENALRGEANPTWKPYKKCIDCGINLRKQKRKTQLRCKGCFNKFNRNCNHWNWQNGISSKNHLIRCSIEYKVWANAVKKRDNYTCQICSKRNGGELHSDHIKPFSIYPELRFDINNGRTLCADCHYKYGWSLFKNKNPRKENAKATRCKSVFCLNTNKVYESYKETCAKLGIKRHLIHRVTSGLQASANGFVFKDLNEELLIF